MAKWLTIALVVIGILGLAATLPYMQEVSDPPISSEENPPPPWEPEAIGIVTYVVDGDTIDVEQVGRVRLADIDTPESYESGFNEATNFTMSLTLDKQVYLDIDDLSGADPYGRIIAVVYVRYNATHLLNVNEALLRSGHAVVLDFDNNEFDPSSWTLYREG